MQVHHRYTCAWISTQEQERVLIASPGWAVLAVNSVLGLSSLDVASFVLLAFVVSSAKTSTCLLCLWISNERIRTRKWECHL